MRKNFFHFFFICCVLVLSTRDAFSMQGKSTETFSYIEKIGAFFPPSLLRADFLLKKYLRSNSFASYRKAYGDSASVDKIFFKAKELSNNNNGVALLISLLGVTDHFALTVKIHIPYLPVQLPLPLTAETKEEFTRRFNNLPEHFPRLFSSPTSSVHKDKLQHFFATAFLSYVFESEETALRIGFATEKGESAFIIGGTYDAEDLEMNRRVAMFGHALLLQKPFFPSQYFFSNKRIK